MIKRVAQAIRSVCRRIAEATTIAKIRLLFIVSYAVVILYITVLSRTPGTERIFQGLFWEYRNEMWNNIFLNMLLFMPLGFVTGSKKGVLFGFLLSAAIEITQYIGILGYCEVDDVLNNTIGTVVGYMAWRFVQRKLNIRIGNRKKS